jgi:hypothetical protein
MHGCPPKKGFSLQRTFQLQRCNYSNTMQSSITAIARSGRFSIGTPTAVITASTKAVMTSTLRVVAFMRYCKPRVSARQAKKV